MTQMKAVKRAVLTLLTRTIREWMTRTVDRRAAIIQINHLLMSSMRVVKASETMEAEIEEVVVSVDDIYQMLWRSTRTGESAIAMEWAQTQMKKKRR